MPIPKPNASETEKEFIKRCMSDETMMNEYQDIDQRFSICVSSYEELRKDEPESGSNR